jgi:hypothetical protein
MDASSMNTREYKTKYPSHHQESIFLKRKRMKIMAGTVELWETRI